MMSSQQIQAKVVKQQSNSKSLLIRAGDSVVRADYSEVAPCEFPIWSGSSVHVEVPQGGVKHHIGGLSSDSLLLKHNDGGLPNTIKFPVYTRQSSSTLEDFETLQGTDVSSGRAAGMGSREPLVAVAVNASGYMEDGKLVKTHAVLPIWLDGSAVLVTLNWYEGELGEGTPNPEWYLRSTDGMPLEMGLRNLAELPLLPAGVSENHFSLHASPCKLAESALGNAGSESGHRIWQREWHFSDYTQLQDALRHLSDLLLGQTQTAVRAVAEQHA